MIFPTLLLSACANEANDHPVPDIVPVTPEQVEAESDRIAGLQAPSDADSAMTRIMAEALKRFQGQSWEIVVAGTDSMNGGLDGWRTCAKFKPEQLGLPPDALVLFFDQNRQDCDKSPDGFVMMMVLAVPVGTEKSLISPTYGNEKMTVVVSNVMVISATNPAPP